MVTEGDNVTRIITSYGKDIVNKVPGEQVRQGKPVDPETIASDPNNHEIKYDRGR